MFLLKFPKVNGMKHVLQAVKYINHLMLVDIIIYIVPSVKMLCALKEVLLTAKDA